MQMDGTTAIVVPALLILLYGAFTYPLYCLGRKFSVGTYWAYWVPVYNLVLLCRCARIPTSNLVWLLVPLTAPGYWAYLWGRIARRLGHSFWVYGLTSLFVAPILILAFDGSQPHLPSASVWRSSYRNDRWAASDSQPAMPGPTARNKRLGLYCLSGEFSGNEVEIPSEGIIIGRRPEEANLVLSSHLVSAKHARVWPDASGHGLMVEDLMSTNGTFYSDSGWTDSRAEWFELRSPKLLRLGARFRLGEDAAEFEVMEHRAGAAGSGRQ
jgi:FHA domain